MVVEDDFEVMFDTLDLERRGYLNAEEIQGFFYSLFYKPVNDLLAGYVLKSHGGKGNEGQCVRRCFEDVLLKLEEHRALEESLYWDFIALDKDGSRLVSVRNCLLLARAAKDDKFSLPQWQFWINSRLEPSAAVSWREFQRYLYSSEPMPASANEEAACNREEEMLVERETRKMEEKYGEFKEILEDDEDYMSKLQQDRDLYCENLKYESQRLLNRWNVGGIEAVIFDDGSEMEAPTVTSEENNVLSMSDLLSGLDTKYDILRRLVMVDMAKEHAALEFPEREPTKDDVDRILHDISKKERKLRKASSWDQYHTISGANVKNRFTPLAVMGDTPDSYNAKWTKAENRFKTLRAEGKTPLEINKIYESETLEEIKGSSSSGDILIHLAKRQEEEKTYLLQTLHRAAPSTMQAERLALYFSLHHQCLRTEEFTNFELSATSACLLERIQMPDFEKYNPDRPRQEKLSRARMLRGETAVIGRNVPNPSKPTVSHSKNLGMVDSWLEITRVLAQKHAAEVEMMMHFLLSTALQDHLKSLKGKSEKELLTIHRGLVKQYEEWKEKLTSGAKDEKVRNERLDLIVSATALYLERLSRTGHGREGNELPAIVLSHLQVLQDVEGEKLIVKMKGMSVEDLYQLRKDLYRSARDEHFENISSLLLSVAEITQEEKDLINVILAKYDKLRMKLFEGFVKNVKDDSERQKKVETIRDAEKRFRNEGNHEKLAKLCKKTLKIDYPLQEVLGPDFSRFKQVAEYYLEDVERSGRKRKLINEPPLGEVIQDDSDPRGNLISELHLRYEDEVEAILEEIRLQGAHEKPMFIAAESTWQQWEMLRYELDDEFVHAALGLGLCERTKLGRGKIKLRQDNNRYVRLAQERLLKSRSLNTKSLQRMASKTSAAQSSLRRVLLCHAGEWTKLYDFLSDDSAEELREAAGVMSDDERTTRLAEIDAKRQQLDPKVNDWQDDLTALLEEAAAIKYVSRMQSLERLIGEESAGLVITPTDVHVSIMADLQEEHDSDGLRWFQRAMGDPETTGKIKDLVQAESRACTNIFNVLCKYEGQADDDEILQALEDKYDSLRDKLLAEALMKQLGAKAWSEMSEKERQERILKMKLEERRLRKEGRYDELAKLLGDAFADEERLRAKLGMSREEYERKLKERLANRRRGLSGIPEEEEDVDATAGDPLSDLTNRYEDEKDALMRMLAGQGERYLSERERQRELARLRREMQKAQREEMFGAAALVLGLAERDAKMNKRLESDRKRQEELAKQRIAALRLRSKKGKFMPMPTLSEEDENIIRTGTKSEMMDAVLKKLELLHEAERAWLVHVLTSQSELKPDQTGLEQMDTAKVITLMTRLQISDKLQGINAKLPGSQVNVNESRPTLIEAGFFRQALLAYHELQKSNADINKEVLDVKMLALLQDVQDRKSNALTEDMPNMDTEKLILLQETALKWLKEGTSENIPTTMFALPSEDSMLEESLEGTHDAILAALAEKALIEKYGEKKWNSMSKSERERLITEAVEKIKRLMAEGKTDEALALLGSVGKEDPDVLLSLFGIKTEEEERKRLEEERLERRRKRIAEGMSEEEADRLMREEAEADEELLKKRRRNILDTLKYDLEAQKAALMRQRAEADQQLEEERRRQLELVKLRLQERLAQREGDLEAVAHVLALSKLRDDQLAAEKQRQLELARKRLEAHRKGRGKVEEEVLPLKLPEGDDVNALIDIIVRELEAKHAQERTSLMKMMTVDAAPNSDVRKKVGGMSESDLQHRKTELRELRRQWRNEDSATLAETASEQMEILVEATAINLELARKSGVDSEESAQEEVLAQLQNQQMLETSHLVDGLPEKNPATLRTIAQVQWRARAERWLDNVAESLLQDPQKTKDTTSEEDEVLKALEDKYDAVKDKLIAEALMRQMGEKEWSEMSEKERQKKIMALKLQERKLRQEGKMDEAATLISSLIKSDEDLARLLGEAKLSQEEELKKRLEKRRKLKEERMASGLSVDDEALEAELAKQEEEEKKQKRKNVLLLLEHNLDEEKEALLASLRRQDESINAERRRQMELAKLKREQRQISREDRFNAAVLIFNQAKQTEEILAANLEENRARQLALAKERLAARKAQKEQREAVRKLFDLDAVVERLKNLEDEKEESNATAPDRLLKQMDLKQVDERELLILFLQAAEMDSNMRMEVSSLSTDQIRVEQEKLATGRKNWREKRFGDLLQSTEEDDEGRKQRRRENLAKTMVEENANFKRYIIMELEVSRRSQPEENKDFAETKNEVSVKWLAEVQTAQNSAVEAVHTLISDKSDEVLDMITYSQKKARMELWNDNVSKVVMGLLPPGQTMEAIDRQPSSASFSSEERAVEDAEKNMQSLDEELQEQKKELEKKKLGGEDIDMEAEMALLEQQYNAKKEQYTSELERQRQKMQEKLQARKKQREEMEYEAYAAAAMVFTAERRLQERDAHAAQEKSRQRNLMQERLEARKKRRKELEDAQQPAEDEDTVDAKPRKRMAPPAGLTRQKTFIPDLSEEQKAETLERLKATSLEYLKKIEEQRLAQQKRVKEQLEKRRGNTVESRAMDILQTFEREKTIVLDKKKQAMERQKTMLQERVQNIRTEKTKTMREKGDRKVRDFEKLVNPEESEGMSKDEKMKLAAENLQKKFEAEKTSANVLGVEDGAVGGEEPGDKLDVPEQDAGDSQEEGSATSATSSPKPRQTQKDRERIMRERMSVRKQKRKQDLEQEQEEEKAEDKAGQE